MVYLKWRKELDTGIGVIDNQHRRIVDYINQLHDASITRDIAIIGKVIEDTVDYTASHFGFEETLIENSGYQFTKPHKRVHKLFIKRINEYNERFAGGEDVCEELHGLLSRWLFSHILNEDAAYVPAVKSSLANLEDDKQKSGFFSRSLQKFFG